MARRSQEKRKGVEVEKRCAVVATLKDLQREVPEVVRPIGGGMGSEKAPCSVEKLLAEGVNKPTAPGSAFVLAPPLFMRAAWPLHAHHLPS